MEPYVALLGIFLVILGIVAFFIPALARVINFPGNEKIKSIAVIIVGIIVLLLGYFYF
ncbi:MAG: hypothetical protein HXS41_00220 [Theionarchaea archaeon]|nr:hypothetical protein [Theionarchaea archaeon]MBU7019455.1 hypothetical protein [Theionarchaea archaeon]